jgi:hypothetical protein
MRNKSAIRWRRTHHNLANLLQKLPELGRNQKPPPEDDRGLSPGIPMSRIRDDLGNLPLIFTVPLAYL